MDITHRIAHLALATATRRRVPGSMQPALDGQSVRHPPVPTAASPTDTPLPPLPPTPEPIRLWLSPALPRRCASRWSALQSVGDRGVVIVATPEAADVRAEPVTDSPLAVWIYAVAAPFPTVDDSIALDELRALWGGAEGGMDTRRRSSRGCRRSPHSSSAPSGYTVWEEVSDQVADRTWEQPGALAVVPFEKLDPRLKVLTLDGQSPLWKSFDPAGYPLTVGFGFTGDAEAVEAVRGQCSGPRPTGTRRA